MLGEENSGCPSASLYDYLVLWKDAQVLNWVTDSSKLYEGSQGLLYCKAGAPAVSSTMSARGFAMAVFFCFVFRVAFSGAGG